MHKNYGVIVTMRHIHMLPEIAAKLGIANGDEVEVEVSGERGGVTHAVAVRAAENSALEMHIDINAYRYRRGQRVRPEERRSRADREGVSVGAAERVKP